MAVSTVCGTLTKAPWRGLSGRPPGARTLQAALRQPVALRAGGDRIRTGDERAVAAGAVVVHEEHVAVARVVRVARVELDDLEALTGLARLEDVMCVSNSCHVVDGSAVQLDAVVGAVSTFERSRKMSLPASSGPARRPPRSS
jgi:hypothetical protein